jgi:hypothetical protein
MRKTKASNIFCLPVLGFAVVFSVFGCSPGKGVELVSKVTDKVEDAARDAKNISVQKALLTKKSWRCEMQLEEGYIEIYERFLPNGIQIQKAKMSIGLDEDIGSKVLATVTSVHSWDFRAANELAFETLTDSIESVRVIASADYRPSFAESLTDLAVAFEVVESLSTELLTVASEDTNFEVKIAALDEEKFEYVQQFENSSVVESTCIRIDGPAAINNFNIFEPAT